MTPLATLLWLLNLACVTAGHLALKGAATVSPEARGIDRWTTMLADFHIWVGMVAFAGEFLLWLAFLSVVPLSLAVLMGSIDTLAVAVGGHLLFGEAITLRRGISIAMITIGVVLVGWG